MSNIAARFLAMAEQVPDQAALIAPEGSITYKALAEKVERYAAGLSQAGWKRGMRAVMMVPAGIDFFALVFAHFKLGAVPVFIDPAMGFQNMRQVIAESQPEAFIGIPKAHVARWLGGWGKQTLKHRLSLGMALPGVPALGDGPPVPTAPTAADEPAAILFTSGSTGVPKGALHTHGSFETQTDFVRDQFAVVPGEVHVAMFPIFGLYDLALGVTTVLPDVDTTKPAKVPPAVVVATVNRHQATCMFGSPAMLDNLGRGGAPMPSLKAIISASGPVLPGVLDRLDRLVDANTTVYVPYGATEGLPISVIGHREALGLAPQWAAGEGLCIGTPLASVELAIIPITDAPLDEVTRLEPGTVGEIAVRGPIISQAYIARPEANLLAKIKGGWHRMGDLGRVDEQGRLWFYGRKAHRVGTHYTIATEAIFLQHPHVARAALVGVQERPVMCIQAEPGQAGAQLARELLEWAAQHPHTAEIKQVLFHPRFPVDIRHNSKIYREALAAWATRELV
ncbi:MAG: AMP-dependent synthetase and ligase [Cyanobacteria bacterium RYN_339]|nr:AMP-dependent synthetase and ligase [Cyanobacteria bacterium RYN_339]